MGQLPTWQLGYISLESKRGTSGREPGLFHSIFIVGSKSLCPAQIQWEEIHKSMETRNWGLRYCPPHRPHLERLCVQALKDSDHVCLPSSIVPNLSRNKNSLETTLQMGRTSSPLETSADLTILLLYYFWSHSLK